MTPKDLLHSPTWAKKCCLGALLGSIAASAITSAVTMMLPSGGIEASLYNS